MTRQTWINTFENKIIQQVENKGDLYLYMTKSEDRESMWHVWKDNNWLICTPNYQAAVRKYEEKKNEL